MSASDELQEAVFLALLSDPGVAAVVGSRIYDRVPSTASAPYISFGPSDAFPDDADCMTVCVETLQLDIWSEYQGGKSEAKRICAAVKAALHERPLALATATLELLAVRQIQIIDDPDGVTTHGVVIVEATLRDA